MLVKRIIFKINTFSSKIWYQCIYGRKIHIGKGFSCRSRFNILIDKKGKVIIKEGCFFNNDCSITSLERIEIGNDCMFGENVKIYDHNHKYDDINCLIKQQGFTVAPVFIGNNCWIGSNVCILKGAKIGNNCVIGAGTVIAGEVLDNTIIYSNRNYVIK